ncbi:UNVERIFIED_CONTAM: hypothetical protein GTU68_027592 [Idotea baltica]|nr:hypothetical protein [Idotea baltica]
MKFKRLRTLILLKS